MGAKMTASTVFPNEIPTQLAFHIILCSTLLL